MAESQPSFSPSGAGADAAAAHALDADDVALGFECADPSLQIERWQAEAVPQALG